MSVSQLQLAYYDVSYAHTMQASVGGVTRDYGHPTHEQNGRNGYHGRDRALNFTSGLSMKMQAI